MTNEEKILLLEQKLKTLQMYYAAVLAETVTHYGENGILDKVTKHKQAEQMKNGAESAMRFGVKEPRQVFQKVQDTFGCSNWKCTDTEDGFIAVATSCMLCAISKKMGNFSPCQIFCLSPIDAMLKAISPKAGFSVMDTLWDSNECRVNIKLE